MTREIESFVRAIPKAGLGAARLDDATKIAWPAHWMAQVAPASTSTPA